MVVKLRKEQETALKNLSNGKVLYGGVGSGKSLTALAYYIQNEAPKSIYVITTAQKRNKLEWEGEAAHFGIGRLESVPGLGRINVDSWHSIQNYTEVEDAFFIFDEQKLIGSGAWVKAFYKIAAKNNWILLSATPGDNWLEYAPIFIANGLYKNLTEFKRNHVVYAPYKRYPIVVGYLGLDTLEKYRNMLLVELPYLKDNVRHTEFIDVSYDKELMDLALRKRWHVYEDRPIVDVAELFRVMREINNTDPSRLETIKRILQYHPKLVVFYRNNFELEILRTLGENYTIAEMNGHKKDPLPDTDSWVYLVQYTSGAEGWNCTQTNAMVFYSLIGSYRTFEQAQGRIDRMNSPVKDLYYYVLVADSKIDRSLRDHLERKELFNERIWAVKNGFDDLI